MAFKACGQITLKGKNKYISLDQNVGQIYPDNSNSGSCSSPRMLIDIS